jgi:phenylacetate-CoA ligase
LLDYDSIFKEIAFIYYYRSKLGYTFGDKLATFRGIEFDEKLWKLNPMYNEIVFSPFKLSKDTLQKYVTKLNDYGPQFLHGYLSTLYFFARLLSENKMAISKRLKGIFLISENIDNKRREYVEQFFNANSSTFYGQSERCIIAEETEKNRYAFDPYYGFTEQILIENNNYEIVGTGFLNRSMPLIRYKINDICVPDKNLFSIESMRKSNLGLYGKNNVFIGLAALNFHNDFFKNVTNYQFIQINKGEADLLIIANEKFRLSDIENMKRVINMKTKGEIVFNIKKVDSLILSSRGKFEMLISNFDND